MSSISVLRCGVIEKEVVDRLNVTKTVAAAVAQNTQNWPLRVGGRNIGSVRR